MQGGATGVPKQLLQPLDYTPAGEVPSGTGRIRTCPGASLPLTTAPRQHHNPPFWTAGTVIILTVLLGGKTCL